MPRGSKPLPAGYYPLPATLAASVPRRRADAKLTLGAATVVGPGAPASLRKAAELGVSHEAVRQAMLAAGLPTDLASRNRAIGELARNGGQRSSVR